MCMDPEAMRKEKIHSAPPVEGSTDGRVDLHTAEPTLAESLLVFLQSLPEESVVPLLETLAGGEAGLRRVALSVLST